MLANSLAIPGSHALALWSQQAQGAFSPNTERAWRSDWRLFGEWCNREGLDRLPATPEVVSAYLRSESAAGVAVATIARRASTISRAHRAAKVPDPCKEEVVRLALKAIRRERGTQQKQARALTGDEALLIRGRVDRKDADLRELRDLAVMLVGRDLMARASELVSITTEAVIFEPDGTTVMLRRHKTSTEAAPYLIGPHADAALRRWLEASGVASGPVFRAIGHRGEVKGNGIGVRDVGRVLKRLAPEAGFSAHSLRVGMAVDLSAANEEAQAIMQAAGWTTPRMLARYTRKLDAKRGAIARYYKR